jgi:hypothetical protein
MTNRKLTSMLLGAATLLGASSAFASIDLPSTPGGNGELVLLVTDTATGNSYAKDLGIHLNDILGDGAVASTPGGLLNYVLPSFNLTGDANFQSLISSALPANVVWGVMGADAVGNNLAANPQRVVQTAGIGASGPNNNSVKSNAADINAYFGSLNGNLGANASVVGTGLSGGMYGISGTGGVAAQTGFTGGIATAGFLGETLGFYYFATSNTSGTATGGGNNLAKVYNLANLTLTAAGLSAVTTEVPLPAAVWLFGSGLLGMAGVGRRRKQKAA